MYYATTCTSPLGTLTLASNGEQLLGLWLKEQKYHGCTLFEEMVQNDNLEVFKKTRLWLERYFDGQKPGPHELPLAPPGSEFRQAVWKLLCQIPYGEVTTYGAIAHKIAADRDKARLPGKALGAGKARMSSQAVGGAVGHNPLSIIIPCHRVVGSNGSLTGYAGGLPLKIKLLKLEGVDVSQFFVPQKGTAL
ncbi:MAG: methylated-DNA--[protein]-cysteine S-methyltransferase [Coriobacteriales bacterium]|jgi:methylated-DNA-[protein]-cysteine S-methyltransferase|nr:methylated-DNA--[protein]-cysteine S-methyltransferase [Coriobacteriales bacterium]